MAAAAVTPPLLPNPNHNLHAAIDMGTNSFKLHIIQADPSTGKFLSHHRIKETVLLGLSSSSAPLITSNAQSRAIAALRNFSDVLKSTDIHDCRVVATSAVREASNRNEFVEKVAEEVGMSVELLSGEDEGKYVYIGALQFVPYVNKLVLCIDIGGGSTEFVIGCGGKVLYAASLRLGHVVLTEAFVRKGEVIRMREYVRKVVQESGLVEKVRSIGYEIAVGSSGTIRAIKKAVGRGYGTSNGVLVVENGCGSGMEWSFSKEELSNVVERLSGEESLMWKGKLFKRRSDFIFAGAVLLEEIVGMLGIDGIAVSGYALGEGLIAEKLAKVCEHYDLELNARCRSETDLASKCNKKKHMKAAAKRAAIAKEKHHLHVGLMKNLLRKPCKRCPLKLLFDREGETSDVGLIYLLPFVSVTTDIISFIAVAVLGISIYRFTCFSFIHSFIELLSHYSLSVKLNCVGIMKCMSWFACRPCTCLQAVRWLEKNCLFEKRLLSQIVTAIFLLLLS